MLRVGQSFEAGDGVLFNFGAEGSSTFFPDELAKWHEIYKRPTRKKKRSQKGHRRTKQRQMIGINGCNHLRSCMDLFVASGSK